LKARTRAFSSHVGGISQFGRAAVFSVTYLRIARHEMAKNGIMPRRGVLGELRFRPGAHCGAAEGAEAANARPAVLCSAKK
jgi:hypothetical protein